MLTDDLTHNCHYHRGWNYYYGVMNSITITILTLKYLLLLLVLTKFKNIKRIPILNRSTNPDIHDLSDVLLKCDIQVST